MKSPKKKPEKLNECTSFGQFVASKLEKLSDEDRDDAMLEIQEVLIKFSRKKRACLMQQHKTVASESSSRFSSARGYRGSFFSKGPSSSFEANTEARAGYLQSAVEENDYEPQSLSFGCTEFPYGSFRDS